MNNNSDTNQDSRLPLHKRYSGVSPKEMERLTAPTPSKPYLGLPMTPQDIEDLKNRNDEIVKDQVEHARKIREDLAAGKSFRSHLLDYPTPGEW